MSKKITGLELITDYIDWLEQFDMTQEQIDKIEYDEIDYPLKTALFDHVLFNKYANYVDKNKEENFKKAYFDDWMSTDKEETRETTEWFNIMCYYTMAKVYCLLNKGKKMEDYFFHDLWQEGC